MRRDTWHLRSVSVGSRQPCLHQCSRSGRPTSTLKILPHRARTHARARRSQPGHTSPEGSTHSMYYYILDCRFVIVTIQAPHVRSPDVHHLCAYVWRPCMPMFIVFISITTWTGRVILAGKWVVWCHVPFAHAGKEARAHAMQGSE